MRSSELDYELPAELIAQSPAAERAQSRLLVVDRAGGGVSDRHFSDLGGYLRRGDCLVLNDTRVMPARFYAHRATGGRLEGLFLCEVEAGLWQVMLKGLGKVKVGERFFLNDRDGGCFCEVELIEKYAQGRCSIRVDSQLSAEGVLGRIGYAPLPPYIRRDEGGERTAEDMLRYQTVYARVGGAVAAPTAGLHFTRDFMDQLCGAGVSLAYVTLHVGPGTFKPVTEDDLADHEIHSEWFELDEANAAVINSARAAGGRIVAVGTTSARTLETVGGGDGVTAATGTTDLFITPGYQFKIVDALVTNFHLPRSTLLALVGAFAGLDEVLAAYRHAVEQRYRFYSYGDAMLIV